MATVVILDIDQPAVVICMELDLWHYEVLERWRWLSDAPILLVLCHYRQNLFHSPFTYSDILISCKITISVTLEHALII